MSDEAARIDKTNEREEEETVKTVEKDDEMGSKNESGDINIDDGNY